ncbi:hypothetical protein OG884_12050 [Streptosporangium sp. NBC_01755]|uniref:hypothetical protein n=1 Tax=Streptosporangium sp. NBC_01755 TaxID=2975949 RepID=UPI002DD88B07|nr:hypothetical protein [Streptosporangium sp. NBC_01755]WSD02595.1 hypothetical protein OG884_12050 [Streptosporangium sp. NBC_01755]
MTATFPDDTAVRAAEELREALARYGIAADVHDGYGLALVSVWVDLIVWCRGDQFWWRTGWNPRQYRPVYARHPAAEPGRAAHRVALRYAELRQIHPLPEPDQKAAYPV